MTLDAVLFAYLSAHAGLSALIGDRVYPDEAPQGVEVPFIVRRLIDETRESGFGADIGVVRARHQLDVYARSHAERSSVKTQLRGALQRWCSPSTDPAVWDTFVENWQELREAETELYRGILDIIIHHSE